MSDGGSVGTIEAGQGLTSFSLETSWAVAGGAGLTAAMAVVAWLRGVELPAISLGLVVAGAGLLALAAGEPVWRRQSPGDVDVLVDLSPSTRTADFRDRQRLNRRLAELLGTTHYRLRYFADGVAREPAAGKLLPDVACQRTVLPVPGGPFVLFSDARFALPNTAPPAYVVVDPALDEAADAAVTGLDVDRARATVSVSNSGPTRRLLLGGVSGEAAVDIGPQAAIVSRPLSGDAARVSAQLYAGDAWPENDLLDAVPPPPARTERWWVGAADPGPGWRRMTVESLPVEASSFLAPGLVVLEMDSAARLDPLRQQRLRQYVNELGGGLLLLGGESSISGQLAGTPVDAISPLALHPPRPTVQWLLLVDGSGSMAGEASGGVSRWALATSALVSVLPHLPAEDRVDAGSFADVLTWWSAGRSARETAALPLPPANVFPHGPTNLQPALEQIARSANGAMPRRLLLMSDADVRIEAPDRLAEMLRAKGIRLYVLAIGHGEGLEVLRLLARTTQGALLERLEPSAWASGAAELLAEAAPGTLEHDPIRIHFEEPLSSLPARDAVQWNRTWLKQSADELAWADLRGDRVPLAARWAAGEGQVTATAFSPSMAELPALVALAARQPRDPRFAVSWEAGRELKVTVDAVDGRTYLNGETVSLELREQSGGGSLELAIPQTAPGRYLLEAPAPRSPTFAAVRVAKRLVSRIAVAGRYAPEFDAVGNDRAAMEELSRRTGGQVIKPTRHAPIDFRWPRRPMPVASACAAIGAMLIALGLAWWRIRV